MEYGTDIWALVYIHTREGKSNKPHWSRFSKCLEDLWYDETYMQQNMTSEELLKEALMVVDTPYYQGICGACDDYVHYQEWL